jgi:hypothetical protein
VRTARFGTQLSVNADGINSGYGNRLFSRGGRIMGSVEIKGAWQRHDILEVCDAG